MNVLGVAQKKNFTASENILNPSTFSALFALSSELLRFH